MSNHRHFPGRVTGKDLVLVVMRREMRWVNTDELVGKCGISRGAIATILRRLEKERAVRQRPNPEQGNLRQWQAT